MCSTLCIIQYSRYLPKYSVNNEQRAKPGPDNVIILRYTPAQKKELVIPFECAIFAASKMSIFIHENLCAIFVAVVAAVWFIFILCFFSVVCVQRIQ